MFCTGYGHEFRKLHIVIFIDFPAQWMEKGDVTEELPRRICPKGKLILTGVIKSSTDTDESKGKYIYVFVNCYQCFLFNKLLFKYLH